MAGLAISVMPTGVMAGQGVRHYQLTAEPARISLTTGHWQPIYGCITFKVRDHLSPPERVIFSTLSLSIIWTSPQQFTGTVSVTSMGWMAFRI